MLLSWYCSLIYKLPSEFLNGCFSIYLQFLQDIFDALFAILKDEAEEYGSLVFHAMVRNGIPRLIHAS